MGIRSAVKAIIVNDGKVLLNKSHDKVHGDYYTLPGGGQHLYETLRDALIRECLEETGYTVAPVRLAALCEEIFLSNEFRKEYPDYAHRVYHVFICELADAAMKMPTEKDWMQVSCEWIDIAALAQSRMFPKLLSDNILNVINGTSPIFLGSEHVEANHG